MKKWSFNELIAKGHITSGDWGVRYLTQPFTTVITCEDSLNIRHKVHHIVHDDKSLMCTVQMFGNYTKVLVTTEFFTLSTATEPE